MPPASRQRFGSFDRIEGGGLRLREPFSSYVKTWVAVVDGNKDQLRSLRKLAQRYRVDLVIIVDFIHVCVLHGEDDPAREEWFVSASCESSAAMQAMWPRAWAQRDPARAILHNPRAR